MLYTSVWLQEKQDWRKDLVSFVYWINKINKWMKYLAGWREGCLFGDEQLLWSGWTVLSGDALGTAANSTGVWPLFGLFMCSRFQTPAPKNATCGKNDWLKNILFFITENFLGISDRIMCRTHDFLSLTLTIVGSTSSSCYFLLHCRCLWVVCFVCFSS